MVTDRACGVADLVHRLDRWLSFELVAQKGARRDIARVEDEVRLVAPNDCGDFGDSPDSSFWQKLAMQIVRMHDRDMSRRLSREPEAGQGADEDEQYCRYPPHKVQFYATKKRFPPSCDPLFRQSRLLGLRPALGNHIPGDELHRHQD